MNTSTGTKLSVAVAAGALANTAGAAILTTDYSAAPITIGAGSTFVIDFDTITASSSAISGSDATFSFTNGLNEKPQVATVNNWVVNSASTSALKLAYGA